MNAYKSPNWDRFRGETLKIGLIISLTFVLFAFNYTSYDVEEKNITFEVLKPFEEEIPVRTTSFPKPPPPPVIKDVPDIILPDPTPPPSDEIVIPKKEPEQKEISTVKEEPKNIPIKPKSIPKPKPAPAPIVKPEPIEPESDEPIVFADYMPLFGECSYGLDDKSLSRNCSDKALLAYFANNIKYPSMAVENGIEGKVFVEFHIDKNGNIKDAIIRRGIGGGCEQEVLRIIKGMPKWKAGKHKGRPVSVKFTIPVNFKLSR